MDGKHSEMFKWRTNLPLFVLTAFVLLAATCTSQDKDFVPSQLSADANQQPGQKQKEPNNIKPPRPEHTHSAFSERVEERGKMVAKQIEARGVKDATVLAAMRTVPRHAFIREGERRLAYADHPLPIGFDQTISQPYIVAFMTQALKLKPDSRVLEIGTGSGYQAAVCAEIAAEVYTIEIVGGLALRSRKLLKELGYENIFVKAADGYFGWPDKAPFDAIIGTAAAGRVPPPLLEQLKPGGRMILPVEGAYGLQHLVLITKDQQGKISKQKVMPVRFVPMVGEVMEPEEKSSE